MPTLFELGEQVLSELGLPAKTLRPFSGNLEQWMSFLSVDQPWLSAAQNYENRARFENVSEAVSHCISRAEEETLAAPVPDWLIRLVWTWCDKQADVFTFNYDTLIERALGQLGRVETWGDLYAASLTSRIATGDGATFGASDPRGPVLSLFKLHGSTSWAFGGLDAPPNDRVVLTKDMQTWHAPAPQDRPIAPRYLSRFDDLVPLIIPPTFTKGPYYSNLTLRAQWRRAASTLGSASELTVMGYSFPSGDLVAQQWVSTRFHGDRMDIVDKAKNRAKSIRDTLADAKGGEDCIGVRAIERYVDRECGPLVSWKISASGDQLAAPAELWVNGANILANVDPALLPWGNNYAEAQRWIHERLEANAPNAADRAVGGMSGSNEDRFIVLPKGAVIALA